MLRSSSWQNGSNVRTSMVATPRGESDVWIQRDQARLNDPFGDLCRAATTNVPHCGMTEDRSMAATGRPVAAGL